MGLFTPVWMKTDFKDSAKGDIYIETLITMLHV